MTSPTSGGGRRDRAFPRFAAAGPAVAGLAFSGLAAAGPAVAGDAASLSDPALPGGRAGLDTGGI
jgi:hypothetical protein